MSYDAHKFLLSNEIRYEFHLTILLANIVHKNAGFELFFYISIREFIVLLEDTARQMKRINRCTAH